jgi:hypothetical protein
MGACPEAIRWAEQYPTLPAAWEACERGDWMLWLAGRDAALAQGNDRHVRLCWAICVIWWELAYPWWYEYGEATGDHRPEDAIEALERFCRDPSDAAEAAWAAKAAGAAKAAWAAEAAEAAEAAWAAEAADAATAAWAADAADAAEAAKAAWAAEAADAADAAEAAKAAGAARAAEAADAADAAKAACLRRIAEIVRETCLLPVLPA